MGPILGGLFTDIWGFERASSILGLYTLLNAMLLMPLFFYTRGYKVRASGSHVMLAESIN